MDLAQGVVTMIPGVGTAAALAVAAGGYSSQTNRKICQKQKKKMKLRLQLELTTIYYLFCFKNFLNLL